VQNGGSERNSVVGRRQPCCGGSDSASGPNVVASRDFVNTLGNSPPGFQPWIQSQGPFFETTLLISRPAILVIFPPGTPTDW